MSDLEHRKATTSQGEVTVETTEYLYPTDKRYRLHFNDFALAREWIAKMLKRYETNDKRIRLLAWRKWEEGENGREVLGRYESKTTS